MKRSLLALSWLGVLLTSGCSDDQAKLGGNTAAVKTNPPVAVELPTTFGLKGAEVKAECAALHKAWTTGLDAVVKIPRGEAKFANTVAVIEKLSSDMRDELEPITLMKDISPLADVRDAANECSDATGQLKVDIGTRADLYQTVRWAAEKKETLDEQDTQLLNETLADFKRNGFEDKNGVPLTTEARTKLIEIRKRIVTLNGAFSGRIAASGTKSILLTEAELEGVDASTLDQVKKDTKEDSAVPAGQLKVLLNAPTVGGVLKTAKLDATRKKVMRADDEKTSDNIPDLEEIIALRGEAAKLLGYASHADFALDGTTMAKNPTVVAEFLRKIADRARPKAEKDVAELLALKKLDQPEATKINSWDLSFYADKLLQTKFKIDSKKIREYFPEDVVMKGMFEIYQTLLGVQFQDFKTTAWHPSVKAYQVLKNGVVIAAFYTDLYPRANKYSHFAADDLKRGRVLADGSYRKPVAMIMGNFKAPVGNVPSLLAHSELRTLFHEFGHVMNFCLTETKYGRYSGANMKDDFPEAPSQMLEHWVYEPKALNLLSGHYSDHSKKLPEEDINKLVEASRINSGLTALRSVALSMTDQEYHTRANVAGQTTAIINEKFATEAIIPLPENAPYQGHWVHLASNDGNYDARYYGYLWSKAWADDMYTRFEGGKLLDPAVGADYVKWILAPGGTKNPFDLLRGFLGREPNMDAYFKNL